MFFILFLQVGHELRKKGYKFGLNYFENLLFCNFTSQVNNKIGQC